ncbi:MAG TPA: PH domain-containing protein [Alphaproteobacteria bacterium]|nr:PH domain-containing protein [Alphaproteobacteria bacterium]
MQLEKKEKILYQNKPKNSVLVIWFFTKILWSTFLFAFLLFWGAGFFGGIYMAASDHDNDSNPFASVAPLFKILLPIFAILASVYNLFLIKTYNYYITNHRIIFEGGIIVRKKKNISFDKITDTSANQNIVEKFLGISSLEIFTAGTGSHIAEASFIGIEDAEKPQNIINRHLKSSRSRR